LERLEEVLASIIKLKLGSSRKLCEAPLKFAVRLSDVPTYIFWLLIRL